MLVIFVAPCYRRFAQTHFQGVTAAAVGAIAGAAVILSRRALVDVPTVLIAVITFAALLRLRKIPEPILILVAGVVGIALYRGT